MHEAEEECYKHVCVHTVIHAFIHSVSQAGSRSLVCPGTDRCFNPFLHTYRHLAMHFETYALMT